MSGAPTTPRTKSAVNSTTPVASRLSVSQTIQSSPHYTTTRRHSLYGVEDRVIIDVGSRIWKVGFSGEGRPRDVFLTSAKTGASLWDFRSSTDLTERAEEVRLLEINLRKCLRSVFHDSLLTDPKARKVILVEHPLLPLYIKDMIARILFENNVPSISFASSHLLSLFAVGRITGLVLDCGHLESVALPIFAARPLYSHIRTTPLAGQRLTSHLRALLLMFGTYLPPPTSLNAAVNIPSANRATRVPEEVLPDLVVEEIKTRCCFVGDALATLADAQEVVPIVDDSSEAEAPPSDATQSESDFSHAGHESNVSSQRGASSEFSIISNTNILPINAPREESHLQAIARLYTRQSTATELHMPVIPPLSQRTGTGRGTLIIPGWIRERAADMLFEGGDVDESSVAEVILDALLKAPVDLRKTFASSVLVSGGTAMLPGFIPRLHAELLRALSPPSNPTLTQQSNTPHKSSRPPYDRYAPLRSLVPYFAILNNPSPPAPMSDRARANSGKTPAFSPATLAWVGGSLAGSLKTGGTEVAREKWDEATAEHDPDQSMDISADFESRAMQSLLPDWTRTPLPTGAPAANFPHAQTQVGAA